MKYYAPILWLMAGILGVTVGCALLVSCGEHDHDCFNGCASEQEEAEVVYVPVEGPPGPAGEGCRVSRENECAVIQCGVVGDVSVCSGAAGAVGRDGRDGLDGKDGDQGVSPVLITPCPDTASSVAYPERLLRFPDGPVVAFLSSSNYMEQRLVTLVPGQTYVTTDGRNCTFTAE